MRSGSSALLAPDDFTLGSGFRPSKDGMEQPDKDLQSIRYILIGYHAVDVFHTQSWSRQYSRADVRQIGILKTQFQGPTAPSKPSLAPHLRSQYTVFACFAALQLLAHLGIKVVLDYVVRFASVFIEDLTPFLRSVGRSIH